MMVCDLRSHIIKVISNTIFITPAIPYNSIINTYSLVCLFFKERSR